MEDPQYRSLDTITDVPDAVLGPVKMQNLLFRMSGTPGEVRHTAPAFGAGYRRSAG